MSKYSIERQDDNREPADSCGLCGETDADLEVGTIAGATTTLCPSCDPDHDDQDDDSSDEPERTTDSSDEEEEVGFTISRTDSSWVEETRPDYQDTQQPYFVDGYSERFDKALGNQSEEALTHEQVSDEADVPMWVVKAIANNNAIIEGVSREQVRAIEDFLNVRLQEDDERLGQEDA